MTFGPTAGIVTRRRFLKSTATFPLSALAPSLSLANADLPPEVRKIRLVNVPTICLAPQYIAKKLLLAEGFDEVEYVSHPATIDWRGLTGSGAADLSLDAIGPSIVAIDRGMPITMLAGVHLGCYELFARDEIRSLRDLKGRVVPIDGYDGAQHVFLSSMAAYVGMDPRVDIRWRVHSAAESMRLYREGEVDAYLGFPPEPQQLRSEGVRRVIVNTAIDKPWSQYFCCMLTGNAEFVRRYPVATKRAIRAILKAADICAVAPESAARLAVEGGFTSRYDFALEALKEVNYRNWRTYDPGNTLRFFSVRLHDVGMVKSSPQQIISRGSDWRFINELKVELKM